MKRSLKKVISFILMTSLFMTSSVSIFADTSQTSVETEKVIVLDDGIYINETFYTQDEFVKLLDTAIEIGENNEVSSYSLAGVVAGTWWIPGVGEVVITTAGIILVGGTVIAAGTWIYNAVIDWFEERAIKAAYEDAKEDGTKTDNHENVDDKSSLPTKGDPYSSKDLKDSKGTKQRRYYDKNGNADMDIDYRHSDDGTHTFPHRHDWNNGKRGSAY